MKENPKNIINSEILRKISDALGTLDFGAVTIKVHDSKIIQIDVTEKKRFDDMWRLEDVGGI